MTSSRTSGKETPRYKRALRIVGRYLNQRKARMVTLGQIEGGFMIHFAADGLLSRFEGVAIQEDDLYDLEQIFRTRRADGGRGGVFAGMQSFLGFRRDEGLSFQRTHPVCPQGYEDVLRTLGSRLDARRAEDVLITEMPNQIILNYTIPAYGAAARLLSGGVTGIQRQETYTRAELQSLVAAERERAQQAIEGTAERLRFEPHDHRLYMEAGRMFHDEGDFSEAAELYRIVVSLLPKDLEAYQRLAELSLERGQQREAVAWLTKALRIDPHNARCHDLLGMAYRSSGDLARARAAFEMAMTLNPTNRTYRLHLAQVLPMSAVPRQEQTAASPPLDEEPGLTPALDVHDEDGVLDIDATPEAVVPDLADEEATPVAARSGEPASGRLVDPLGWDITTVPGVMDPFGWELDPQQAGDPVVLEEEPRPEDAVAAAWPSVPDPFDQPPVAEVGLEPPAAVRRAVSPPTETLPAPAFMVSVSGIAEDQIAEAIGELREAIAQHPEQRDLHRKLGFLLARQGRTAEAAQEFARARGEEA